MNLVFNYFDEEILVLNFELRSVNPCLCRIVSSRALRYLRLAIAFAIRDQNTPVKIFSKL